MADNLKDLPPLPDTVDPKLRSTLNRWREALQTLRGNRGDPLDTAITRRDAVDMGLVYQQGSDFKPSSRGSVGAPGTSGPPGPPGASYTPDLTPPPTVSSLTVTAGLTNIIVEFTAPTYAQGHGNQRTDIYAVKRDPTSVDPLPTFGDSVVVMSVAGSSPIIAIPSDLNVEWHVWAKYVTADGVASTDPAGGTNGEVATTGKIGNADLGALIVQAGNLANGSVSASKVADGAIDQTKFATGLEPVSIVASVPGSLVTKTVFDTTDGKLYRWDGSAYVSSVAADDVTGMLTDAQLADIEAAKITGQITTSQITPDAITTPLIAAGAVTTAELAAGAVTAANIAAGTITATEIAAGAITTSLIAADAVTAGQIAAGAIGANQIAAKAITTEKLLLGNTSNLITNSTFDTGNTVGWQFGAITAAASAPGTCPTNFCLKQTNLDNYADVFSVTPGEVYTISMAACADPTVTTGTVGIGLGFKDINGVFVTWIDGTAAFPLTGGWHSASGQVTVPATAAYAYPWVHCEGYRTGTDPHPWYFTQLRCTRANTGELIVDGAITASKIAANAIAVGTAAIQNGAIVNAMIGNAAIDDAKISNVSAAKLTAGMIAVGEFIQSTEYVPGSTGWKINGNGNAEFSFAMIRDTLSAGQIAVGSVDASKISVTDLSSMSATIGTLRTTSSGARVEIKDNKIGVFDDSNVLRVRIGDLSGTF